MKKKNSDVKNLYLECEKNWVYFTLTAVSGFFGAYTYLLKGGVFCNAQTGNVVLLGLSLGAGEWKKALYYLIPIAAYIAGAFVSELLPGPIKHKTSIRWDTFLIGFEMLAVIVLGFLPDSLPVQISQIAVNFIASMQYNTFRQAQGVAVATTFVTNHVRQIGIGLAKEFAHRKSGDKSHREKFFRHCAMLFFFLSGVTIGTVFCNLLSGKGIWVLLLPFGVVFSVLLHADLTTEKELIEKKPSGH